MTLRRVLGARQLLSEIKGRDDMVQSLAEAIQDLRVPGDVEADLLGFLHELVHTNEQRPRYRAFQNYSAVYAYLSQALWNIMMSMDAKAGKVFDLMDLLGLFL
jgi:hypothetical protein